MRGGSRVERLAVVGLVTAAIVAPGAVSGTKPATPRPTSPSAPVVVKVDRDGFQWLDAGLGAAAAFAVMLVVAGLALAFHAGTPRIERRKQ